MKLSQTQIQGVRFGTFSDERKKTGCHVLLFDTETAASADVRGASPGTREVELLDPMNKISCIHGLLLTGGSAFGLDSAAGIMKYLKEKNKGYHTPYGIVPIVPAAVIYDLGSGDPNAFPGPEDTYNACKQAKAGEVLRGQIGAGTGATVGKFLGRQFCSPGGCGFAEIRFEGDFHISALAIVNALGNIIDPHTGNILAGARKPDGSGFTHFLESMKMAPAAGTNTTLITILTDMALTKIELKKISAMAHDGMARVINPVHTMYDGDIVFAVSTLKKKTDFELSALGALAAEVTAAAILDAVL